MRRTHRYLRITVLLISLILSITFTGCHKDYIYIADEFGHKNVYNNSKTEVAFYKFMHVAKPPKNFGTSKTIYKKTALYIYNIETEKLTEVYNFNNLPSGRDNWIHGLSYQDNLLAFSIRPISSWKYYKEYQEQFGGLFLYLKDKNQFQKINKNGFNPSISPDETNILYFTKDSENAVLWKNKFNSEKNGIKLISDSLNHYTKFIWTNDNEVYLKEPKDKTWKLMNLSKLSIDNYQNNDIVQTNEIDIKTLKELTKNISYKEWGIDINICVPKSEKARIKDIITGYGSQTYRMAILQEIQNNLTKQEIKDILTEIGMHKENLSSFERQKYDNTSESVIKQLNILSNQKE